MMTISADGVGKRNQRHGSNEVRVVFSGGLNVNRLFELPMIPKEPKFTISNIFEKSWNHIALNVNDFPFQFH